MGGLFEVEMEIPAHGNPVETTEEEKSIQAGNEFEN
jgi:hypothetical protein